WWTPGSLREIASWSRGSRKPRPARPSPPRNATNPSGEMPARSRRPQRTSGQAPTGDRHGPLLHRPSDLRLGDLDDHHGHRHVVRPYAARVAVSADRATHGADYRDLSGRVGADGCRHGDTAD